MERRDWMAVLAKADPGRLAALWAETALAPGFDWLRPPEIGAVMVRGRAGATGAPFNLGEMTVTRCALRLSDGREGHAHVPGRDRDHARVAALCDALMQGDEAPVITSGVLEPLGAAAMAARDDTARKADATRVSFFTMSRERE